jgi:hypothetical protein
MTFNQPTGPAASAAQLRTLLELLSRAGHDGFRDARGPLGFTQRQGNGKFTRDEAQAFIDRLEAELDGQVAADPALRDIPSPVLAAELQRRGWIVVEP